jgi:hypothetical protein
MVPGKTRVPRKTRLLGRKLPGRMPGRTRIFLASGLLFCLLNCGGDSGLQSLGNYELAERHATCLDREPTAPGSVQACKNIARECDRRKTELGQYVCRSQ